MLPGCGGEETSHEPGAQNPQEAAARYIEEWRGRTPLPDEEEIEFFASNLAAVETQLGTALVNPDSRVRMHAAHVIGQIGPPAARNAPAMTAAFQKETDPSVRHFMIYAMGTVRSADAEMIRVLTERFGALSSENVPPPADYSSTSEVDEKIQIAATLYVLSEDSADRQRYFDFVTQWLREPPAGLSEELVEGWWDRRFDAVGALARMPGATDAVPLLEALLKDAEERPWLQEHLPRAIEGVKGK